MNCILPLGKRQIKRNVAFVVVAMWMLLAMAITPALALDREESTNINVYALAAPAVVTINVMTDDGPSSGAGTIIAPTGLVLTSSHVIGEASTATIVLDTEEEYEAKILARIGQRLDLAILKIQGKKQFPYVEMGQSTQVRVGQKVLAIGNPYGFERTLTQGIVSRLDIKRNRIQTDASINPGNSGGPLLDTDGRMIGINQSIFNPEGRRTNIGIGFAVPVDAARKFVEQVAHLPNVRFEAPIARHTDMSVTGKQLPNIPVLLKKHITGQPAEY